MRMMAMVMNIVNWEFSRFSHTLSWGFDYVDENML